MKNTGIVRRIDHLGRVTLPMELRRTLGIDDRDPLEIYTDDGCIILKSDKHRCVKCGSDNLVPGDGLDICWDCANEVAERLARV